MIYNLIGQPHSGKTTIANHLKNIIKANEPSKKVFVLDSDELRKIFLDSDYSKEGRIKNIKRIYSIACYLHRHLGRDVIIAAVSPFLNLREEFKSDFEVIEIYVHTTNIRGREHFHTQFETPACASKFIDVDTTDVDEITTMNDLLNKIENYKNI